MNTVNEDIGGPPSGERTSFTKNMEMKIRTPRTNPFLAPKARLRKARSLDSFHSTGLANSASSINIVGAAKTNTDKALTQPAAFVATNNRELARLQPVVNSRVLLSPEFNSDYPFVTRASAAHRDFVVRSYVPVNRGSNFSPPDIIQVGLSLLGASRVPRTA